MDDTLPTRLDDEYTRIDKFEKYEYTHCIAYELARRNIHVENSLNLLLDLFVYYDQIILPILIKYEKVTTTDNILDEIKDVENIYKEWLIGLVNHYDKKQFSNDFENLTFENIKVKFSYLVETIVTELYNKYYIIYQHDSEKFTNNFSEIYDSLKYLERDKLLTTHVSSSLEKDINLKDNYKVNFNKNRYFTIYQSICKDQKDFSFNTIYPNFTTSIRDFSDTKIVLNLNLPKNEIIDYIEKIKNDYDNKNSIIKTPIQLLEDDLEVNDNLIDIKTKEWADTFFIYDYYNMSQRTQNKTAHKTAHKIVAEIQIELTKYHGLKIKKTPDEIKNTKDNKYKQVSWKEHLKENPDTDESNIYFDTEKGEKAYLSTKSISHKYNIIKNYIEGDNPKYKALIH